MGRSVVTDSALQFDEATHTYTVNGVEYPSVTTILKDVGLIDTSGPWYTDWHRDRGTQVHLATALDDANDLDTETLDPAIKPYLSAWWSFMGESRCKIIDIERRAHHPRMMYAGTIDRVVRWGAGDAIIDIKCGPPSRWHGLQTAAYKALVGGLSWRRATVHLSDDGTFKVASHNDNSDHDAWNSALALYHWKRNAA